LPDFSKRKPLAKKQTAVRVFWNMLQKIMYELIFLCNQVQENKPKQEHQN